MNTEKLFKLALKALANNHIKFAARYFEKALLCGHELSVRYYLLLYRTKDEALARDIILCAERWVAK